MQMMFNSGERLVPLVSIGCGSDCRPPTGNSTDSFSLLMVSISCVYCALLG